MSSETNSTGLIFCAFATRGRYEIELRRLVASLDALGLEHHTEIKPDLGSWEANTRQTGPFVLDCLNRLGRPFVCLDADAYVHRRPILLEGLAGGDTDIAAHYRAGHELLNGTLLVKPTPLGRKTIELYADMSRRIATTNEQQLLAQAIEQVRPALFRLPAAYCWIHDIMAQDLAGQDPVIEHLQASREAPGHVSPLTKNRKNRLVEIGHGPRAA